MAAHQRFKGRFVPGCNKRAQQFAIGSFLDSELPLVGRLISENGMHHVRRLAHGTESNRVLLYGMCPEVGLRVAANSIRCGGRCNSMICHNLFGHGRLWKMNSFVAAENSYDYSAPALL